MARGQAGKLAGMSDFKRNDDAVRPRDRKPRQADRSRKLDLVCSPSVMIGEPVSSNRRIVSLNASSAICSNRSGEI